MKKPNMTPNRKAVIEGGDYTPIPNALIRNRNVPHSFLRVFCVINSFDPSYPSVRKICENGGVGSGTVQNAIKWLEERKVLIKKASSSRLGTNEYFIRPVDEWCLPECGDDRHITEPDTSCIPDTDRAVSDTDTAPYPRETPNNSKVKKSNLEKREEKLSNDSSFAQQSFLAQNKKLPNHFIQEAVDAYQSLFARKFNGQRYLKKYVEQFHGRELQEKFVEQCIHFSKYGGTVYGRVENEFLRLSNQKTLYPAQPRFLQNDASFASYQMALNNQASNHQWPRLIYPLRGKFLKTKSFDDDPEAVLATRTLNRVRVDKDIRRFEKMRWEEQPKDVVQIGPYIFNYLIIKSYLHFGSVSAPLNQFILVYEKATGAKLFRPDEEKTISGLNMKPMSVWSKVYCPKPSKRSPMLTKTRVPENVWEYVSQSYQRLHGESKEQASSGGDVIRSETHRMTSGGV